MASVLFAPIINSVSLPRSVLSQTRLLLFFRMSLDASYATNTSRASLSRRQVTRFTIKDNQIVPDTGKTAWSSRFTQILRSIWIPSSATLHPNYTKFVLWSLTSAYLGSITYVFSTQSIFRLITRDQFSVSTSSTAATVASVTRWLLRDALGQVGGVLGMAVIAKLPDVNHKALRVMAKCMLHGATFVEITLPRFIGDLAKTGGFHWWAMFTALAVTSGVFSNMAWIAASAARAHQLSWLSRERAGKIGELTARGSVQATTAHLLGNMTGILANGLWLAEAPTWVIPSVSAVLMAISIFATRQSCRYAWQAYLDRAQLPGVLSYILQHNTGNASTASVATGLSWKIPTPEQYSMVEPIIQKKIFRKLIFEPFRLTERDLDVQTLLSSAQSTGLYTKTLPDGTLGIWIVNTFLITRDQQNDTSNADQPPFKQLHAYLAMAVPEIEPERLTAMLKQNGWELQDTMRPGPNSIELTLQQ